jgi:hypothetical protein
MNTAGVWQTGLSSATPYFVGSNEESLIDSDAITSLCS